MTRLIKALIVEDEPSGAEALEHLLEKFCPEVELLGIAHTADEAQKKIDLLKPDLLFLDIEMPGRNGFDLLQSYKGALPFQFIITTAFDHYAMKAIRASAVDYLLKPVDAEELCEAVMRAQKRLSKKQNESSDTLNLLLDSVGRGPDAPLKRIAVHQHDGILFIDAAEIVHLDADSNYTHIHLNSGKKITSSRTLKEYEELLRMNNFMRVHNAHIANLSYVDKYVKGDGGMLVMRNGSQLDVARSRKNEVLKALTGE